jgi:hypothetical protein
MLVVRTEARLHPVLVRQITWAIPTLNANLNVKSIVIVHTTSLVSLKSVGIHALGLAEPMLIAEWSVIIPSVAVLLDTLVILWNPVELHLQSNQLKPILVIQILAEPTVRNTNKMVIVSVHACQDMSVWHPIANLNVLSVQIVA